MGIFDNLPYTNFHELNLDWIIKEVKKVREEWDEYHSSMDEWKIGVDDELAEFRAWFENLDVQDEIRVVINEMVADGRFLEVTTPTITSVTESWLASHVDPDSGYVLDNTLTIQGAAADAKAAGDQITDLKSALFYLGNTLFRNIIDPSAYEDGYYRGYADGDKRAIEGYTLIDYIPTIPDQDYYFENVQSHVCYFNANKTFISGTVVYNNSFTPNGYIHTPVNCAYMSISIPTTSKNNVSLVVGSKAEINIPPNDFGGDTIQKYLSYKTVLRNRISFATWVDGEYLPYNAGTAPVTNSNYSWSSAIKINEFEKLALYPRNNSAHICFYTGESLSTFISGTLMGQFGRNDINYIAPANAEYMRISVPTVRKNSLILISGNWIEVLNKRKIFEVGPNKEFTTILEALEYVRTNSIIDAEVNIYQGEYNFINEITSIKGSTFIQNYTASEDFKGYFLGGNIKIKGVGSVTINCDYTPTDPNDPFAEYCSIFHVYDNGYSLDNITVNAKGCRYIIHDDSHSANSYSTHIGEVKNCHFVDNGLQWGCILGGGLFGKDVRYISNCDFIISAGISDNIAAYYHTNNDSDASTIRVHNCYCEGCTFKIKKSGTPSGTAAMYVSNSHVNATPFEDGTGNIKMIEWNNVVSN